MVQRCGGIGGFGLNETRARRVRCGTNLSGVQERGASVDGGRGCANM